MSWVVVLGLCGVLSEVGCCGVVSVVVMWCVV